MRLAAALEGFIGWIVDDGDGALDIGAALVEDLGAGGLLRGVFGIADGEVALGFGDGLWVAERHAGGAVEDAADGPCSFVSAFCVGEEDFAGALLLRAVVPAAEKREVVGERGEVGWGGGFFF